MKLKDDIIKWKEEAKQITAQMCKLDEDYKSLKEQVERLAKITEEMTEAMLTLIRQQLGD